MEYISVILAAGEGTRMKSKKAKTLHEAAGLPLMEWVLRAVDAAGTQKNIVVCGRAAGEIKEMYGDKVLYAEQKERLGSGHAVMVAREYLEGFRGYTLIVAGDMPLLTGNTIHKLVNEAVEGGYDCMMLSAKLPDPFSYGRIVRNAAGDVIAIVEEKDATEAQRGIDEVNASCYCVKNDVLLKCLDVLEPKNAQGEYYITDIVGIINHMGGRAGAYPADDYRECMGVNTRAQLAEVAAILRGRILEEHMASGVTFIDPNNAYVDADTKIGADTVVYPGVVLEKGCEIGEDVTLYPGSRISNSKIGNGTAVQNSVVLDSKVGDNSTVGPYAYLRPGTNVGDHCRIGDFVEVKNSNIGDGTKVSHLTYVGDADMGKNINVGCGVVFVNYDGKNKYRSMVENNAFIGCNTNLISPVTVGEGAYIAAGSTITDDVPGGGLAIARARQVNKGSWKDKRKG